MAQNFYAILTAVGEAKDANAKALGIPLVFTEMAVGDGNGIVPVPDKNRKTLVREVRRAPLNSLTRDKLNANQVIAEQIIPESVGGWFIRELGLFDADGDLVAIANCPETYKPLLAEGSGRVQAVRLVVIISSADNVQLNIDPSIILATREYVDNAITVYAAKKDHKHAFSDLSDGAEVVAAYAAKKAHKHVFADLSDGAEAVTGRLLRTIYFKESGIWNKGAGTTSIEVEVLGGGGASGGCQATNGSEFAVAGSGGAGGYAKKYITGDLPPQKVTIGAGGVSKVAEDGGNGGTTSFGTLLSATGGEGGGMGAATVSFRGAGGGEGGMGAGGDINCPGAAAGISTQWAQSGSALVHPSLGACSIYGASGRNRGSTPQESRGYGAGGTAPMNNLNAAAVPGQAGTPGIVIVREYA